MNFEFSENQKFVQQTARDCHPAFGCGRNAFAVKLAPAGNALTYATYLSGSSSDDAAGIAVDDSGSAYIAGDTASTDL